MLIAQYQQASFDRLFLRIPLIRFMLIYKPKSTKSKAVQATAMSRSGPTRRPGRPMLL